MSIRYCFKLAATNIKNNSKTYIPYIIASIGSIMMFYILCSIKSNPGIANISGGDNLRVILALGVIIVSLFSIVILLYTNSFLIKRRKKEFGLYNILGMEKKHIGKVIACETIIVAAICIAAGLFLGIILDKLIFMILLKLISFSVPMGFIILKDAAGLTVIIFAGIYFLSLLNNLRQIHLTKPIELLKGGSVGEKEPKVKWPLVLIGLVSLGAGYYLAVTTENPLQALLLFFVAVILVIIGTYCLFTAGSIAIFKTLKKKKSFYYKPNNFTTVSGMIYRMKQNAVGLASICILSTMVLVTVSTTVALYAEFKDNTLKNFSTNTMAYLSSWDEEGVNRVETIMKDTLKDYNLQAENEFEYREASAVGIFNKDELSFVKNNNYSATGAVIIYFIPVDDLNKLDNISEEVGDDEVIMWTTDKKFNLKTISFLDKEYKVKKILDKSALDGTSNENFTNLYYIAVKDMNTVDSIRKRIDEVSGSSFHVQTTTVYGFDAVGGSEDTILEYFNAANDNVMNNGRDKFNVILRSSYEMEKIFLGLYGGLLFVGIFLGIIFLMATVLIIYYKQVSEGYDDRSRFEIMQKVGMSSREVKKSIHKQIVMVFFIPVVAAVIHICFASKFVLRMLAVFGFTNVKVFAMSIILTVIIFAIIYGIVYLLTAKTYYRIVNQKYEY